MTLRSKIRVLVVEDSPVVQALLVELLRSDPQFDVIGTADNGEEAVAFVARNKPDVVLMDVHMPKMNGIEATRRIMETQPVPIVVASATLAAGEVPLAFRAMEAGALAFVDKSAQVGGPRFESQAAQLKQMLRLMSEVKVVRRWNREAKRAPGEPPALPAASTAREFRLVALGASTGGPPVLRTILSGLPRDFPLPLLIVQHITPGFVQGLADWLTKNTGLAAQVAVPGEIAQAGRVYLAPDDAHLGIDPAGRISLSKAAKENGLRPAVSYLFRSVAQTAGAKAIAVLLTGMGKDGAAELKQLRQQGAMTLAQDRESSAVFGMPGEAVALDAAHYVLPPERIAAALISLVPRP